MKEKNKISQQISQQKAVLEEMDMRYAQHHSHGDRHNQLYGTMEELFMAWLMEKYGTIKKSTYANYAYCVKMHIIPLIGPMPLRELSGGAVLSFIEQIQLRELADSTLRLILTTFKTVMKYGIQKELIGREILVYCSVNCRRTESRVLTVHESTKMKDYLLEKDTIFSLAILLCRGTGIRIGELCGLKWEDIDFVAKTIRINRTISRIPNPDQSDGQPRTVLYIRTPKSHTSIREIPIPGYLIKPLNAMQKDKNLYVLTGKETCTEPRNVQKKFKTVLKHCDMKDCNFHAMRHGFATACLEQSIDCKTVSSILGHASTRTTMDFYVHTSLRQKMDCIDAIN